MNRINQLFLQKPRPLLSLYFCAGSTGIDDTPRIIRQLAEKGVDMIEIGIPFSDPMADGPVIQEASTRALRHGITLRILMDQLRHIRRDVPDMPLLLMGYLNPIMQYGFENFCRDCAACGVDGMIIPDLPFDDYIRHYRPVADRYGLRMVMLITPETSEERIRLIDEATDGFIYMVSTAATTGAQQTFSPEALAYFERIAGMGLRNPRLIGFGISNHATYASAARHAAGCIIGSQFVKLLDEEQGNATRAYNRLMQRLR